MTKYEPFMGPTDPDGDLKRDMEAVGCHLDCRGCIHIRTNDPLHAMVGRGQIAAIRPWTLDSKDGCCVYLAGSEIHFFADCDPIALGSLVKWSW